MAGDFLDRVYSHDNCGLDEHSQVMRITSQLVDYHEIEAAFMKKYEREKHTGGDNEGFFPQIIFVLRVSKKIRRDDLAEQAGCSVETVKRAVRLLKRFNLIETTRDGYRKTAKCNKFLRRLAKANPEFFEDGRGSGFNSFDDNDLTAELA
jgi:hypothetical protein